MATFKRPLPLPLPVNPVESLSNDIAANIRAQSRTGGVAAVPDFVTEQDGDGNPIEMFMLGVDELGASNRVLRVRGVRYDYRE